MTVKNLDRDYQLDQGVRGGSDGRKYPIVNLHFEPIVTPCLDSWTLFLEELVFLAFC